MFEKVKEADESEYVMTCSSVKGLQGLSKGHAYTLLGVVELKDKEDYVLHKLYKIRNPWGAEEYIGPWSDNDTLWTPTFREQAGSRIADDGIFFVEHYDFVKFFDDV